MTVRPTLGSGRASATTPFPHVFARALARPCDLRTQITGPPDWSAGFDLYLSDGLARLYVSSPVMTSDGLRALAALASAAADRLAGEQRR